MRLKPLRLMWPMMWHVANKPDKADKVETNKANESKADEANEAIVANAACCAHGNNLYGYG